MCYAQIMKLQRPPGLDSDVIYMEGGCIQNNLEMGMQTFPDEAGWVIGERPRGLRKGGVLKGKKSQAGGF